MINGKNIVAVCTSRIHDHQLHSFLAALNEHIIKNNCRQLIYALNSDLYWTEEKDVPESYVFDIIPFDKVDCLIWMDEKVKSRTVAERVLSRAKEHSVPVIVIDGEYEGFVSISYDYQGGFENVVRHVIEMHGARKPHFMAGIKGNKFSDERIEIFRKVITENGIAFDDSMVSYGEFWALPARAAAEKIVKSGNIPDAVICANDIMAINVSDVFVKAGIKVPEQVIVTGFDGVEESLLATPAISTAGCDSADLADAVYSYVKRILSGDIPRENGSVLPKLSPNASCGCEYIPYGSQQSMDNINSCYYRYQDDVRSLYDISSKMQLAGSKEEAASYLNSYFIHDVCCMVYKECFDNSKNFFAMSENDSEMTLFYDSYPCEPLKPGDIVTNTDMRFESGYPLIFNALDYMSKPFGYVCYSFRSYEIIEYSKTSSITNTISMGLGGYVNMRYQRYLTEKMTSELKVASQLQMQMLPTNFIRNDRYEIHASMIPAKNVGGDFYDFFNIDGDHLGLVIADVSGKGVPAALFMAASRLIIHERALLPGTPAEILDDVNKKICVNNKMGLFITIWFGILDLNTGIITYANAGHEYPVVKLGGGSYTAVTSDNLPPVGVDEDMEYEDLTIDMSGGGTLFLYTDGVTDIKNGDGEHFGLERTVELLNGIEGHDPEDIIKGVNGGISGFGSNTERFDDTTMLCVSLRPAGNNS